MLQIVNDEIVEVTLESIFWSHGGYYAHLSHGHVCRASDIYLLELDCMVQANSTGYPDTNKHTCSTRVLNRQGLTKIMNSFQGSPLVFNRYTE